MMEKSGSFVRSFVATNLFLRKRLWIWPVIAAVVLAVFGWWVRDLVEIGTKKKLAADLETILNADVAALRIWLHSEESKAKAIASDPHVVDLVTQLIDLGNQPDAEPGALLKSAPLGALRKEFGPWLEAEDYPGFLVVAPGGKAVAGLRDDWIGKSLPPDKVTLLEPVFQGETVVTRPQKSLILLPGPDGTLKAGVPTMFALAPVQDDRGQVIAALGLRIRPEADFTRILTIARAGESGETYAFDENGLLLSQSRFDEQLKQLGLITDDAETQSILNLAIRDPEVDMTRGKRPKKRRSEQSLTRMAADAVAGKDGVDVDGYRDYRGAPVIGAWTWLSQYGFGVATEVDVAEAYRPIYVLRTAFGTLFTLLAASAAAIFAFTVVTARLEREARKAAVEAKQLGQYSLDEKIGAGGMGVVYRAHHAMLRRPTAVKLLDVEKTTDETIARFEREVQLTSQLNHPNTIAIYDYGRTPEGVFYYAMEYLDGVTLDDLVDRFGPQPEGRVIHVLRQVCGSLNEAHGIGLVHRDIKPANLILNERGGMFDVVKVLDFGLVKALDAERDGNLTAAGSLTGTPLYLSPEGIQQPEKVDARSDLYAVGAVGYFLATGTPVFRGETAVEICMHHVQTPPERLSERLGRPVSEDFEALIMQCLAKDPNERPPNAQILAEKLAACRAAPTWTRANAESWWRTNAGAKPGSGEAPSTQNENLGETIIHDAEDSTNS